MAREQDLNVTKLEPERFDVRANERNSSFKAGIDEDVTVRGGNEIAREALRADVVKAIGNAMRGKWIIPITLSVERAVTDNCGEKA